MRKFFSALTLGAGLAAAGPASAQVTALGLVEVENGLDGFITNDLILSFDGQLTGFQLLLTDGDGSVLTLDSSEIFNSAPGSGDTPPSGAFFGFVPELEFDTFFGVATTSEAADRLPLFPGSAVDIEATTGIEGNGLDLTTGINVTVGIPAEPQPVIADQDDFFVGRITLADTVSGELLVLASANGVISETFAFEIVPEPTSAGLLGFAGLGLLARRRK